MYLASSKLAAINCREGKLKSVGWLWARKEGCGTRLTREGPHRFDLPLCVSVLAGNYEARYLPQETDTKVRLWLLEAAKVPSPQIATAPARKERG